MTEKAGSTIGRKGADDSVKALMGGISIGIYSEEKGTLRQGVILFSL